MALTQHKQMYGGFTLVEVLLTLAIAVILIAAATPSFRVSILNSQQVANYNNLLGSLQYARSEAIKRASRVSVCARQSDTSCGNDWNQGWLVFTDSSATPGILENDEEILRIYGELNPQMDISNRARLGNSGAEPVGRPHIRFGPRGTSNWRGAGSFTLCDERGDDFAVALNVSLSGDLRKARKGASDNAVDVFGDPLAC